MVTPRQDNVIVITTIFPPSTAARQFVGMEGWHLIVAGDRKTPADWSLEGCTFLSAAEQEKCGYRISRELPWNHYCRKMIGYVHAIKAGARVIADTDDDNLPKEGWAFPEFAGRFRTTADNLRFVNVYGLYTDQHIWPRGFPLERITSPGARLDAGALRTRDVRVGIWQAMADGDPDVDAIYRLTNNAPCTFNGVEPVVLGVGTMCPFNSQNTAFRRECFPLLYLPAHVTFRFTDILRGLVAQPILWAAGYHLGFTSATVVQERNPHDYLKDFQSEIPCYLHAAAVLEAAGSLATTACSIPDNLHRVYRKLAQIGIVPEAELKLLDAWLEDLAD